MEYSLSHFDGSVTWSAPCRCSKTKLSGSFGQNKSDFSASYGWILFKENIYLAKKWTENYSWNHFYFLVWSFKTLQGSCDSLYSCHLFSLKAFPLLSVIFLLWKVKITFLFDWFMFSHPGKEHISRTRKHPHLQHHRTSVCGAVVPSHPAQRPHQRSRCGRREDHQRIPTPQIPFPDHEHPAHGAVQGVCRVCHQ